MCYVLLLCSTSEQTKSWNRAHDFFDSPASERVRRSRAHTLTPPPHPRISCVRVYPLSNLWKTAVLSQRQAPRLSATTSRFFATHPNPLYNRDVDPQCLVFRHSRVKRERCPCIMYDVPQRKTSLLSTPLPHYPKIASTTVVVWITHAVTVQRKEILIYFVHARNCRYSLDLFRLYGYLSSTQHAPFWVPATPRVGVR